MNELLIFSTAFVVGLSGSMVPGPLTAVAVEKTLRRGFVAAPLVALGHGAVDAVLVVLLAAGMGRFLQGGWLPGVIGLAGGAVLVWMGLGMVRGAAGAPRTAQEEATASPVSAPLGAGILATLTNPYWFLWWATVGAGYVLVAQQAGARGVLFFLTGHVLSDLIWLSVLALALVGGRRLITDRVYSWMMRGLGLFLLVLALYFFRSGVRFWLGV